jgi:hypothetical protein
MSIEPNRRRCAPACRPLRSLALAIGLTWIALLVACGSTAPPPMLPLACDDSIKTAFKPGGDTTVVAVRQIKKGEALIAQDSASPITAAADLCLVKLLVGPGATAETDTSARSYTRGIGIEVWLPTQANWNERVRNYGGGGWVGGGHRYADKIGSKVPRSSMPTWATHRAPPTPASRGTRTARSRFCPTARSIPSRFATSRRARWSSRPSRPRTW